MSHCKNNMICLKSEQHKIGRKFVDVAQNFKPLEDAFFILLYQLFKNFLNLSWFLMKYDKFKGSPKTILQNSK